MSILFGYLINGIFNNPLILYILGVEFFLYHDREEGVDRIKHYSIIFLSIILVRAIFHIYFGEKFIRFIPIIFLLIYILSKYFENLLNIYAEDNIIIMSSMTIFLIIGKDIKNMGNLEFIINCIGIFIFFIIFSIIKNSFYDSIYGKEIPDAMDGYPTILFVISGILIAGTILRGIIS